MSESELHVVKAVIATLAFIVLLLERRAAIAHRVARRSLIVLGVVAISAYFHFGEVPYRGYYHRWEMFHYYLGAKYSEELGYKRLYSCVAVAEARSGHALDVAKRRTRNLDDDSLRLGAEILERPQACTRHFSAARFDEFARDVAFFRRASGGGEYWAAMQADHGYNPAPAWTLLAKPLANLAPASHRFLFLLSLLDLALMFGALAALAWGFGARAMALAAIFWGTQAASEFSWTGGAFLRQDWLFLLVASIVLMRRRRHVLAGFLLTAAGMLRIFPLLLWAGPLIVVIADAVRRGGVSRASQRLLLGGALCGALLGGASLWTHDASSLRDFARRLELRATSAISNHMSLRTLFSASGDNRLEHSLDYSRVNPVENWASERSERLEQLRPLYVVCALCLVLCFVAGAAQSETRWAATSLAVVLVPVLTDPSCYYYSLMIAAVPLTLRRRELELVFVGVAALGQLAMLHFTWADDRYVALAALYTAVVIVTLALFVRAPARLTRFWFQKETRKVEVHG
jgi:hypothetical protein